MRIQGQAGPIPGSVGNPSTCICTASTVLAKRSNTRLKFQYCGLLSCSFQSVPSRYYDGALPKIYSWSRCQVIGFYYEFTQDRHLNTWRRLACCMHQGSGTCPLFPRAPSHVPIVSRHLHLKSQLRSFGEPRHDTHYYLSASVLRKLFISS